MTDTIAEATADGLSRPTPASGLNASEVGERVAAGQTNQAGDRTSRTFREIVVANVFTRFNAILGVMLVIILAVGPAQDALFGIVLVANALIGVVQETRAKRMLDRLAVLNAPIARVVRDDALQQIDVDYVVLDDIVEVTMGDQLSCDGTVVSMDGLEIDESLLTGESDPITKAIGARVLSGSIVVAGFGRFQATHVGPDAYARKLAADARRFTLVRSELQDGINQILKWVTWALAPTALLLAFSQWRSHSGWREALAGVVAGVVAMVPEGLVLLTSLAFAVAAAGLARRKVLVQELPAVEVLARVDVICLDKTGTLTEGVIAFDRIEGLLPSGEFGAKEPGTEEPGASADTRAAAVTDALAAMAAQEHGNATMNALCSAFPDPPGWERIDAVPFSSARKWSAVSFAAHGSWVIGAPEMVGVGIANMESMRARAATLAETGRRVLLLAWSDAPLDGEELPHGLVGSAFVLFEEKVRDDAAETLRYFSEQGVALRVISGDNPLTVGAVAARVGLPNADRVFDARELPDDIDELGALLDEYTVFGRVSPHQKRAMVQALQARGHVVAMTGDGVNDALALKDADIGIAMGNGAAATRAVAQLVLLDGKFAVMPGVVAEGRRVIANVERVANMFVTKTVYAMLLALAVGVARWQYPFLPRHLTIVSSLTIGIPAFFIALAPNSRRYVPGFITRVVRFAIPAGGVAAAATFGAYGYARNVDHVTLDESRTAATLVLMAVGLTVLVLLARPINPFRGILVSVMIAAFLFVLLVPALRDFYALEIPSTRVLIGSIVIASAAGGLLELGWERAQRRRKVPDRVRRFARR